MPSANFTGRLPHIAHLWLAETCFIHSNGSVENVSFPGSVLKPVAHISGNMYKSDSGALAISLSTETMLSVGVAHFMSVWMIVTFTLYGILVYMGVAKVIHSPLTASF